MDTKLSCSAQSNKSHEQLFGTAPRVDHWFLIEYQGHWGHDAFEESNIPDLVKQHIKKQAQRLGRSKILLIKRDDKEQKEGIRLFYAYSTEFNPRLYRFDLSEYEEIGRIDFVRLLQSGEIERHRADKNLVLVCTHGSRDVCCGAYGYPIYRELKELTDFDVWRVSHIGGHRFAVNLVMLPEGIFYGRVDSSNLERTINAHRKGEINLECFRGRSCYSVVVQVSDYFLRERIGKMGIYDLRLEYEKDREYYSAVEFKLEDQDLGYAINSVILYNAVSVLVSCDDEKYETVPQFYFYSMIKYIPSRHKKVTRKPKISI